MNVKDASLKNIGNAIKNAASDLLTNSDFISRTIGMNSSYDDIMFIVQMLGREPISLLGKDYPFMFDHVRRNFQQGVSVPSMMYGGGEYGCPKFTFYKEVPTVRFADPYQDPLGLLDRWMPNMRFESTSVYSDGGGTSIHYSESNDGVTNNKRIGYKGDLDSGNPGTYTNSIFSYGPELSTCDLIKKTNDNFNHGKYNTLIARFHTNSDDSKSGGNNTQTAKSNTYGMSHGRNLLKITPTTENGYDNPYCRVWTYHHQYNQISRMIRPFGDISSAEQLEKNETSMGSPSVGFRTVGSADFDGGSTRLDKHGVLNYRNGFVNIAPTAKIKDYFDGKEDDENAVSIKRCMFSIENLAWRDSKMKMGTYDQQGLSAEQKGPLGGRIMWFPPYDLQFNEDVSVEWNGNKFIGRGEQIYTHTNTDRRGNLSFTLLIDHPSILDYWTGHKRNGMKNNGRQLSEGNGGGVDNVYNQENTLLRFFAGCDVLTAKPQDYYLRKEEPKEEEKKDPTPEPEVPGVEETPTKTKKQIQVLLFYPNNYSGVDDNGGTVNPIYYLMNGIGTQRRYDEVLKTYTDVAADVTHRAYYGGRVVGGYETQTDVGVSLVTSGDVLQPDYSIISGTYGSETAQYLTDGNGEKIDVSYEDGEPTFGKPYLCKIIGSKALGLSKAKGNEPGGVSKNVTGPKHLWYRRRYYYRVDKAYENQEFSRPESYIDGKSYGLNRSGFANVRKHSNVIDKFGIKDDSDTSKLISFTDLFLGLEGLKDDQNITGGSKGYNAIDCVSESDMNLVKEVFTNKEKYSDIEIDFTGHASYQGSGTTNNTLARNRAETFKYWINNLKLDNIKFGTTNIINQPKKTEINVGGQDDEMPKIWRSASVTIKYNELSVSNAVETKSVVQTDKDGNPMVDKDNNNMVLNKVDKKEIPNGQTSNMWNNLFLSEGNNGKTILQNTIDAYNNVVGNNIDEKKKDDTSNEITVTGGVGRYDNEGEFFELLDKEAPFLHHLISEKIRYFDPAFHSISPEGFNARLTFLHQCTRQGPTIEHGNPNQVTAYNLAFGRPPVCVLRLGDFFNTKIIINSLNIQYETPQWDLNPEGIGVMPMFAKISLQFTFLGGSDLSGPIARLQNAVSFNYYANASVYDNRAEMVEYAPDGSGRPTKFKGYVYPNLQHRKAEVGESSLEKLNEILDKYNKK